MNRGRCSVLICLSVIVSAAMNVVSASDDVIVIGMCRPSVSQIKNIEVLFEKDLISLKRIVLLGIYHEDEKTDYGKSLEYVERNDLHWVKFHKITGQVPLKSLFTPNDWSADFRTLFATCDGIIFTGGMDIPPVIYGEETGLLTEATTPVRNKYEVSFLFHLVGGSQNKEFSPLLNERKHYPVLAICLGAQTLNVAAGGSLVQDIPTEIYGQSSFDQVLNSDRETIHSARYLGAMFPDESGMPPAFHRIQFTGDSIFIKKMGLDRAAQPFILTSHHQAIERLGYQLKVTATSLDGKVIEIVEHTVFQNVVGVQFHPESAALYAKGRFFKEKPGAELTLNLRDFLAANPPSFAFHRAIWAWFSAALSASSR